MGIQNSITNKCDSLNVTTTATIGTGATVTTGDVTISSGNISIYNKVSDTTGVTYNAYKSRAGGAVITTGDYLAKIDIYGRDTSSTYLNVGGIHFKSYGTIGSSRIGSEIQFLTHPDSTTAASVVGTINNTALYLGPSGSLNYTSLSDSTLYFGATNLYLYCKYSGADGSVRIGNNAGRDQKISVYIGMYAGYNGASGNYQTMIGNYTGYNCGGNGSGNTFIGVSDYESGGIYYGAGSNLGSSASSSNILIGWSGTGSAVNNTIRIGKHGTGFAQQDKCYIAGIYGQTTGATAGVVLIDSDSKIGSLSGTAGKVLMGGAKPAFSTTTYPSTTAQGDIIYASAGDTLTALAKSTDSTRYLSNTGSDNNPAWAQIDLSDGVTGVLPPDNGGAITWEEVTGTTKAMEVSHAYIANNASQVVFTLPATAALGTIITVQGLGSGEWKIEQNADQQIHVAGSSTTVGTSGYVEADARYDSITMVCVVADEEWVATSYIGTLTVA